MIFINQIAIKLGTVEVPIVIHEGVKYYPISFISEKILLRNNSIINKNNKQKYGYFIKKFQVDYGAKGLQETNCISEEGLKLILSKTEQSRLSVKQRKSQNKLMKYLGLPLLSTDEFIVDKLTEEMFNRHDAYTKDLILQVYIRNRDIKFQMCSKCEKYYPMKEGFFNPDRRTPNGFTKVCYICAGKAKIFSHENKELEYIIKNISNENPKSINHIVSAYKADDPVEIYYGYLRSGLKRIPTKLRTKENYLTVIQHLYDIGKLNINKITQNELRERYKLYDIQNIVSMHEIYVHLFGEDYYYYPWRYKGFQFKEIELTYEIANKILKNYIDEYKIDDSEPLKLNYVELASKTRIRKLADRDMLYFAVQYNNFQYAGYMFDINGKNYYKDNANCVFDMKYLIEKELNLPIEKIPLYITKGYLQREKRSLYHVLLNKYNGNLFRWINQCYPNKFIESDFKINRYRDEFDSLEESQIHDILTEHFRNVIYNSRNQERTIIINEMIPDWLIFTDNGCWLIEYFGMYLPKQNYNTRMAAYIEKTHLKMKKYHEIEGYNKLFIYPDDLKNNFKGLKEKLRMIGK